MQAGYNLDVETEGRTSASGAASLAMKRLLASCGVGGAVLTVMVDGRTHSRGAEIRGRVIVSGGSVAQQARGLWVGVAGFHRVGSAVRLMPMRRGRLSGPFRIEPREAQVFPFSLTLPDDTPLSISDVQGASVRVEMPLAWAPRAEGGADLHVLPHREILAVYRAMLQMGFSHAFAPATAPGAEIAVVAARYAAPLALRDQMDDANLTLSVTGTGIYGELTLRLKPHDLRGRLGAMLAGTNNVRLGLQFGRAGLLTPHGEPNPEGALPELRRALSVALVLPDAPEAWMLRASNRPDLPDELLRPASRTGDTRPSELLRSADRETPDAL